MVKRVELMNKNAGCFGKKTVKIYIPIANLIKKKETK